MAAMTEQAGGPPPAPLGGFLVGALSVLVLNAIWLFYLGWLIPFPFGAYWMPYAITSLVVIAAGFLLARSPRQKGRIAIGAVAGWLLTLAYVLVTIVHV